VDVRPGWRGGEALDAGAFAALRRAMIFDGGKWDPQNEAGEALARYPIVLGPDDWQRLASLAERLERETLAAEREIASRPELLRGLPLPRRLRRALAAAAVRPREGGPRFTRYDFHATPDGWRISEANTDVPGGFLESCGLARLVQDTVAGARPPGDSTRALVAALAATTSAGADVALVHATAYVDDRQVMLHLARHSVSPPRAISRSRSTTPVPDPTPSCVWIGSSSRSSAGQRRWRRHARTPMPPRPS
jgi:hypothetical protein